MPQRGRFPVGAFEFEGWRRSVQSFDEMALVGVAPVILTGAGEPERLDAARVSPALFPMLGVDAAIGRTFVEDEAVVGRHRVVVLSDGLWRRHFGADPSIIGRPITLNDASYVVIGILPARFRFPKLDDLFVMGITGGTPQLWMPFAITDKDRSENSFAAIAKLKSGVSADQARSEVAGVVERLTQQIPNAPKIGADVVSLHSQITGASRELIVLTWAAISVVLLIACGNIANLLLARSISRGAEIALRSARREPRCIMRQALVRTMALAAIGGAGGVLFALWFLPLMLRLAPPGVHASTRSRSTRDAVCRLRHGGHRDGRRSPAGAARGWCNLMDCLKRHGQTSTPGRRENDAGAMVVGQTALTVVCLAAAGLVLQSFRNVLRVEPGFKADHVLTVDVSLSPGRQNSQLAAFIREVESRLGTIPDVTSVAFINKPPLTGISLNSLVVREGTEQDPIAFDQRPLGASGGGHWIFRTFGIPLAQRHALRRDRDAPCRHRVPPSPIVRAREDPVGKRFRLTARDAGRGRGRCRQRAKHGLGSRYVAEHLPALLAISSRRRHVRSRTSRDAGLVAAAVRAVISATNQRPDRPRSDHADRRR